MSPDRSAPARRLDEALKARERGWVLCRLRGKVPIDKGWQNAPAPSVEDLEAWASQGDLGLRTGQVSGVVVVDDDSEDGSAPTALSLPRTMTVITGSGKRHAYFRCPGGGVPNSCRKLAPNVDVRGDGGQVVFVGSIHPDTGRPYEWAPGLSPDEVELAEFPEHLLEQLRSDRPRVEKKPTGLRRDRRSDATESARRVLGDARSRIARASEGERNETLNRQAFRLGRWVGADLIDRREVENTLSTTALGIGLSEREVRATLKSGIDAGIRDPHDPESAARRDSDESAGSQGPASSSGRPTIVVEGGALPEVVDQAEQALLRDGRDPIYQRGSLLVRTVRAQALTMRDIYKRAVGVLMLCMVEAAYLAEKLTRSARWLRPTKGDLVEIDCPAKVARTYIARTGHWRVPRLLGVIEAPTLRPDGSILDTPGYDEDTCLVFDTGGVEFPVVPAHPTKEDAARALAALNEILKDFPWLAGCDRAAALAAILTATIRPSLRTAPLFAFRAPKMASGKSLLADVVAMIATGRTVSVMSQGRDEEEDKKRMLAILIEGIPVACIDNIERPLGGAALCSVLTQETWRERILGKTGTATVPTATTWLATGNNLAFVGDLSTRVVVSDLDPQCEKPEDREFDVDLHEYVPAHRGKLVVAALTILRAYHVAGRPDQGLKVFGRFEQWSGWVRAALVWLGEDDPCEGRKRIEYSDPVRRQLRMLLVAWDTAIGPESVTAADVIARAEPVEQERPGALMQALLEVASGKGGKPDTRRLGNYLSKYERRPEAGLRVERMGDRQGVALWRVAPIPGPGEPEDVGFAGFVGPCPPVENSSPPDPAAQEAPEARNEIQPAGEDPPNPPNPQSAGTGSPDETHETHGGSDPRAKDLGWE